MSILRLKLSKGFKIYFDTFLVWFREFLIIIEKCLKLMENSPIFAPIMSLDLLTFGLRFGHDPGAPSSVPPFVGG